MMIYCKSAAAQASTATDQSLVFLIERLVYIVQVQMGFLCSSLFCVGVAYLFFFSVAK